MSKQSGFTLVDNEHLNVTLKQAQSKDILISVFGRFNAGKSTLLNAVMADRYDIYPIVAFFVSSEHAFIGFVAFCRS